MPYSASPANIYPMTVVMATLGGPTLKETIEQLNRGTVVPAEILICIPQKEAESVSALSFSNVRVLVTDCRGQVAQRAKGFENATHDVVMQLDDDIILDEKCVECLLQTLWRHAPDVAVAPVFEEIITKQMPRMGGRMMQIYYWLMNGKEGFQMGAVSRAGAEFSCDAGLIGTGEHEVEWVPGGCILHFRKNLITENYFPYRGKAYGEDLLHSYHLRKNGIKLIIAADARCRIDNVPLVEYGFKEFMNMFAGEYRARKYFVRLTSRSLWRMHMYYLALIFNYLIKKMIVRKQ